MTRPENEQSSTLLVSPKSPRGARSFLLGGGSRRRGPPSYGSPALTAQTPATALPDCGPTGPTRPSVAGTPADMQFFVSTSWTPPSQKMKCRTGSSPTARYCGCCASASHPRPRAETTRRPRVREGNRRRSLSNPFQCSWQSPHPHFFAPNCRRQEDHQPAVQHRGSARPIKSGPIAIRSGTRAV